MNVPVSLAEFALDHREQNDKTHSSDSRLEAEDLALGHQGICVFVHRRFLLFTLFPYILPWTNN